MTKLTQVNNKAKIAFNRINFPVGSLVYWNKDLLIVLHWNSDSLALVLRFQDKDQFQLDATNHADYHKVTINEIIFETV